MNLTLYPIELQMPATSVQFRAHGVQRDAGIHFTGAFLVAGTVCKPVKSAVTNALSCSTSPAAVRPNLLTTAPVPFRKKARSPRAAIQMPNDRRAYRLRFRDGRSAPALFPPSLRVRFTFPFAEPQAEVLSQIITVGRR